MVKIWSYLNDPIISCIVPWEYILFMVNTHFQKTWPLNETYVRLNHTHNKIYVCDHRFYCVCCFVCLRLKVYVTFFAGVCSTNIQFAVQIKLPATLSHYKNIFKTMKKHQNYDQEHTKYLWCWLFWYHVWFYNVKFDFQEFWKNHIDLLLMFVNQHAITNTPKHI